MTTYSVIPDTNLDPGKPVRSVDGKTLRDNPIAITEGASGAPRIRTAALQAPEAGTAYLINRVQDATVQTTSDTYADANLHKSADYTKHVGVVALVSGVVTAYGEHAAEVATLGTSFLRVIKNGALIQEWSTTSFSLQARQVNVSVSVGDVVVFQQRCSTGTSSVFANLRIYSNQPDMAVA